MIRKVVPCLWPIECHCDKSEDNDFHCFKEGEPCNNGRDLLKQQLEIINDNEEDPFKLAEPTEEDCEAAHPAILHLTSR